MRLDMHEKFSGARQAPLGEGRLARLAKSQRRAWRKLPMRDRAQMAVADQGEFGAWARHELALQACAPAQDPSCEMERRDKQDALMWIWAALDEKAMDAAEGLLGEEAWDWVMEAKDRARRPMELAALVEVAKRASSNETGRWAARIWESMGIEPQTPTDGVGRWAREWDARLVALRSARQKAQLAQAAPLPEGSSRPGPRL